MLPEAELRLEPQPAALPRPITLSTPTSHPPDSIKRLRAKEHPIANPLYHFTSATNIQAILDSGYLKTVESNISLKREHAGPDVVWLTTSPSANAGHGLQGSLVDKTEIRVTVEVDSRSVHKWREWARARGSNEATISALTRSGGSGSWRVVMTRIPAERWTEVRNMVTGEVLLDDVAIRKLAARL